MRVISMGYKFKILTWLTICFFLLFGCSRPESKNLVKRYPYKTGKIIYSNTVQETTINQTLYFEDYGELESISSIINMSGEDVMMKSVYKGDYCYTASSTSEKIGKTRINRNELNHLGFFTITSQMLGNENAIKLGEEYVNDKKCTLYQIKRDDYDMELWVWENVIMKLISKYRGTTMTRTVKEITELENLSSSHFDIPLE